MDFCLAIYKIVFPLVLFMYFKKYLKIEYFNLHNLFQ